MASFRDYYSLVKPGIIYGNAITLAGGFALASLTAFNAGLFFAALIGLSLVIGSGCVFNNIIDRDIDARMARTKDRPLVMGRIAARSAAAFGTVLGIAGFGALALWTNAVTLGVAAFGFFAYLVIYTLWAKRHTVWSTVVGSASGAVPPVVGYCAVTGRLDFGAVLLFLILCLWQIPHFYAIAIYRGAEYRAAGIPVWSNEKGMRSTKVNMIIYIVMFLVAAIALSAFGYAGNVYLSVAMIFGALWLGFGLRGFRAEDDNAWARKMFFISLAVITVLFLSMFVDAALRLA